MISKNLTKIEGTNARFHNWANVNFIIDVCKTIVIGVFKSGNWRSIDYEFEHKDSTGLWDKLMFLRLS